MRRTSYQRGFVAGEAWAITWIAGRLQVAGNEEARAMVDSLGPVARVAGFVGKQLAGEDIAADDYEEWSEEELRDERRRIVEALDSAQYFGTMHHGREEDETRASQRAFERIPENLRGGVRRYLDEHIQAGSFLMAVFAGDLPEAFSRADIASRAGMWELVSYLYNYAPAPSWGSKRKVEMWLTPPIPIMDFGRPEGNHPKGLGAELEIDSEGRTACPNCGETHPVHGWKAEPGCVTFPNEGPTKKQHQVQYVWCQQVHLVVVGVDGLEVER